MPEQIQYNPFNRPPRIQDGFRPVELDVPVPPTKPEDNAMKLLTMLLPMASFVVMGLFYSLAFSGQASGISGWLYALPMVAMGIFTFATSFVIFGEQKQDQKQHWIKQLRDYHRLLDKKESRLLAGRVLQLDLLERRFPSPEDLLDRVRNLQINLWERRLDDPDFLTIRLGVGNVPSHVTIRPPDPDTNSPEIRRAFNVYSEYRQLGAAPVTVNLRETSSLALVGHRNHTLAMARSILAQVATLNSPEDVHIFLFSAEQYYKSWQWLRWLPHLSSSQTGGQPDFLSFGRESSRNLITAISKILDMRQPSGEPGESKPVGGPSLLVIFDNETDTRDEPAFSLLVRQGKQLNAVAIVICNTLEEVPSDCQAYIEISDKNHFRYNQVGPEGIKLEGIPDKAGIVEVDNLSHRLIPVTVRSLGQNSRIPTNVNLLQAYQVGKLDELQIETRWFRLPPKNGLLPFTVQIGNETYANPLKLELAENRDGPHGIVAGTTGSGKSELLQTLVSALAVEHHPYFVNFMLIDFKGGSTFGVFNDLPHVVGMVSNLDKTSALRALEAIKAENMRRQRFLSSKGVEDINEYHEQLHRMGYIPADWEPLPHLFIIVDEFAQMAQDMPNFLPELVATVRVGRSLGLHLVLATQRPAGVVSDEMRANLNFRISLRVQTIDDSRDMLRRPDAALLPHDLPGRAYFQLGDGGTPRQFQTARVGVAYDELQSDETTSNLLYLVQNERRLLLMEPAMKKGEKDHKPSIARCLVDRMQSLYNQQRKESHFQILDPILLPPLSDKLDLAELMNETSTAWNPTSQTWQPLPVTEGLRVPVGRIDDLSNRKQPACWIDFQRQGGHLIILGAPGSGKTVFLRSLVYALAMRYSPEQVNIYVLSFAGRSLDALRDLPQVGDVIQGSDLERLHRLIRMLQSQMDYRKQKLGDVQADDLASYNAKVPPENRIPALCILVDNFGELRNTSLSDELEEIERLIQDGRAYGLYFVLAALQGNDIPYKVTNLIEQRLALNLTDRNEYILFVGRPASLEFDPLPAGRGFVAGTPPLNCQLAFPMQPENWVEMTQMMKAAWEGHPRPTRIDILPTRVYLSNLLPGKEATHPWPVDAPIETFIGLDGNSLRPANLNWSEDGPHFLIGGPSQSGRTSLLHTAVLSITCQFSPEEVWVVLMDGTRGSLRKLAALPHVIDWVTEEDGLARNIACLQNELAFRRDWVELNTPEGAAFGQQVACPFPAIVFVIDDYDLTCEALALNDVILTKLGRNIRQDSDLGFHLMISAITHNLGSGSDPLIKQMKLARSGMSLVDIETLEILGGRPTPAMRREELPEGRGYLVSRSGSRLVQFAFPDERAYQVPLEKWAESGRAVWPRPASVEQIAQVKIDSAPAPKASEPVGSTSTNSSAGMIDQDKALEFYLRQQQHEKGNG